METKKYPGFDSSLEKHPLCSDAERYWEDDLVQRLVGQQRPVSQRLSMVALSAPTRKVTGEAIEKHFGNRTLLVCTGDYTGYLGFRLSQESFVRGALNNGYFEEGLVAEMNANRIEAVAPRAFNPANLTFASYNDLLAAIQEQFEYENSRQHIEDLVKRQRDIMQHTGVELFLDLAQMTGVKIDRKRFIDNSVR